MNDSDYNPLHEKSWRRKLTPAEEAALRAWLAQHPEAASDWETDARLTRALDKLPDAPVPSNFTARVLQAVERESVPPTRSGVTRWRWFLHSVFPKAAAAAVAVVLGVGVVLHEQADTKRRQMVQSIRMVSGVSSLPDPEVLQDFETIRQLPSGPDQDLIALMK
jgi:anti-sigma factor RsiW